MKFGRNPRNAGPGKTHSTTIMKKFCVKIEYPRGLGGVAYLSHRNRSEWSRRQAQRHAADIRNGKTGIRNFGRVSVVEV